MRVGRILGGVEPVTALAVIGAAALVRYGPRILAAVRDRTDSGRPVGAWVDPPASVARGGSYAAEAGRLWGRLRALVRR